MTDNVKELSVARVDYEIRCLIIEVCLSELSDQEVLVRFLPVG